MDTRWHRKSIWESSANKGENGHKEEEVLWGKTQKRAREVEENISSVLEKVNSLGAMYEMKLSCSTLQIGRKRKQQKNEKKEQRKKTRAQRKLQGKSAIDAVGEGLLMYFIPSHPQPASARCAYPMTF